MKAYSELNDFVNTAVKNRKYQESTAQGLRAALKLFEKELSVEERASLDLFKSRFDQIYQSVFSQNAKTFSASSLEVYKRRVKKVLSDYEAYGTDPSKLDSWSGSVRTVVRAKKAKEATLKAPLQEVAVDAPSVAGTNRIELLLRGSKAVVIVPEDFTENDAKRLKAIIDTLVVSD